MAARETAMRIKPRAADQLRALDPHDVTAILNRLRDLEIGRGSHIVEVTTGWSIYPYSIVRHRDGLLVLLNVEAAP